MNVILACLEQFEKDSGKDNKIREAEAAAAATTTTPKISDFTQTAICSYIGLLHNHLKKCAACRAFVQRSEGSIIGKEECPLNTAASPLVFPLLSY